MTENEANIYSIAYRDCKEVAESIDVNEEYGKASTILFYMDEILEALNIASELQSIGTLEEYELAINESIDKHNLMVVYKDRLKEFEDIGTIDEFKALKEKNEPKKILKYEDGFKCPICNHWVGFRYGYCDWCGQKLDWSK